MSKPVTVTRRGYPPVPWLLNALLTPIAGMGLSPTRVDMNEILALAQRRTGLSDWGDESFKEGMRRVVDNVGKLGFTPLARLFTRQMYLKAVEGRLRIREHMRAHPEISQIPVKRPIFVVGFPRTGTTAMQNLLALHPDRRGLQFWELFSPVPVDADPTKDYAKRTRDAKVTIFGALQVAPEQAQIHDVRWDSYEECWYLFYYPFAVLNWDIMTGLNSYGEWLLGSDMKRAYAEYRECLQILLAQRPAENLLLKCPEHLWFVDDLLATFPDACIIWTHRDPYDSLGSYASLMSLTRRLMFGGFEPEQLGPYIEDRFLQGVTRAMEARKNPDVDRRFFDVDFKRLHTEPEAVLRDVSRHFDLDLPADTAEQVKAWELSDRADKKGSHAYDPVMWGVDRDRVHARFADYMKAYNISPSKPKAGA